MDSTISRIHNAREAVNRTFRIKWDEAEENAEFYRMVQFSDAQKTKIAGQGRVPYVFDFITSPISTFIGIQRDTRRDATYLPFEQGDEIKVELCNMIKDSLVKSNNYIYLESDVFQGGLIEKTGVIGYEWSDQENPMGTLNMFLIPQRQMSWDLNNREFGLDGCSWVSRTRKYPKKVLISKYPDYKKQIDNLDPVIMSDLMLDDSYLGSLYDNDLDSVALIEFYEKVYDVKYHIIDVISGKVLEDKVFNKKKEVDKAIKELKSQMEAISIQSGQPIPQMDFRVKAKTVTSIRKVECSLDLIFVDETIDQPFYPYDKYHPYFHDGEWWSEIDLVKDPQKYINRNISMVDHQILTGSKGLLITSDKVPKAKAKQIAEAFNKTGGYVGGVPDPDINIKFIPPSSFDAKLLGITDFAVNNLEKKVGGANFLGRQESSNESGTLFNQRVSQGSMSSFVIYDNLSRFNKNVFEKVLWYITNLMSASQKVRIEGEELTKMAQENYPEWFQPSSKKDMGWMEINTDDSNTVSGLKADTFIEETKHSVTKNQMIMSQIVPVLSASPSLAQTLSPLMFIDLLDAPASVKRKWRTETEQKMQEVAEAEKSSNVKPPSLSASLKDIAFLPPEAQAQFAAQFNLTLNEPVTDKEGVKIQLDQQNKGQELALKLKKHIDSISFKEDNAILGAEMTKYELKNQPEKKDKE